MEKEIKQQFQISIESLSKLDDHQLEKLEKHWLEHKEASQKALNRANTTLEFIKYVKNSRKTPDVRLEELKANTGVEYQNLEENSNYN